MSPQATGTASAISGKDVNDRQRALEAIAQGLRREAATAEELREALIRQRAGVAADSAGAVHASCDDIARILVALDSARRHRVERLESLIPARPATLEALAAELGGTLPPGLSDAAQALRRAAGSAAREAAVNRTVLQRTVEAGEAFLQALFAGTGEPDAVYRAGERRDDGAGFLLDRTA